MSQDRRVAVIGLGYVGLPLAISFVEAGLTVEGIDAFPPRVAELNAGSSPIDDVSDARLAAALASGLSVVAPDDARMAEADAIFVCVPTPITTTKDPDLAPVLSAAETIRDPPARGPARHPPVDDVPRHDDRTVPRGPRADRPRGRRGLRSRLRAGAGQPGRPGERQQGRAAAGRGDHRRRHRTRRRAAAQHQRARRHDVVAGRGRAVQAPRERLPQRQHRVRQQPRPAVRADGPRRLGGHQRGRDEAVRLHEVHAGSGRRRPLHPGGPVLPGLARARVRLHRSLHRARRRHQLRDAAPRRRPRRRGAQRSRPGAQGRQGRRARRGVQAERPRRPQLARRRTSSPASPAAARTSASTTRTCPPSRTASRSSARTRTWIRSSTGRT